MIVNRALSPEWSVFIIPIYPPKAHGRKRGRKIITARDGG